MTESGRAGSGQAQRARGDDGTAVLEFAIVAVLLFTLIFGIINFGLILSFKQDMTRAAAEGARAGAVAVAVAPDTPSGVAAAAAQQATREAVEAFGGKFSGSGCDREGMVCAVSVGACEEDPSLQCVSVTLTYDYGARPLYGNPPLISAFLPNEVKATSVARINE